MRMRNWKGFEWCILDFGLQCQDFLADWEKLRNLSQNRRRPCQDSKPVPPERVLQFQGVIPTQSYLMSQCYNPQWQNVPYNSTASSLHQASRCHSVTTKTACFIFPFLLQEVKVVYNVHTFYTSKSDFNIILAPA